MRVREYSRVEKPDWVADLRDYRKFAEIASFAFLLDNGGAWLLEPEFFNRLAFDDDTIWITRKGDK